jgi:myo-inositol-1(or 4)-monophosphatase
MASVDMDIDHYLELAEESARCAGMLLLDAYKDDLGIQSLAGREIKTEADCASEDLILKSLKRTGLNILSEECGIVSGSTTNYGSTCPLETPTWIVDPLDGTFNFDRGMPACCVSIALWRAKDPVLGVVYDFISKNMYTGVVGRGAFCNGRRISVSNSEKHSDSALATGFPAARDYRFEAIKKSIDRVREFKKIRMIGSAALSLAYVSAGIFDAYLEEDIWLWDVAAGLALVAAAGGRYRVSPIKESWQLDVYAGNGALEPLEIE